jgi:hypothetical protein
MARRRLLIIIFALICLLAILLVSLNLAFQPSPQKTGDNTNIEAEIPNGGTTDGGTNNGGTNNGGTNGGTNNGGTNGGTTNGGTNNNGTNDGTHDGGNMFVIPETPLGTIGLISAAAIALVAFTLIKKRKNTP